jgi:hypothetical protein
MTIHQTPTRPDQPGGPSSTPIRRAGSPNHQATPTEERPMTDINYHVPAGPTPDPSEQMEMTTTYSIEDLHERWRELTAAVVELLATGLLIALAVAGVSTGVVPRLLDQYGHWGWFAGGVGAALLLDMAATALGRLTRAGWLVWLAYRPAPAWAPVSVLLVAGARR